jgi:hypothetical protein
MMNWKRKLFLVTMALAACGAASTEPTNTKSKVDYSFFKIIPDRNIFNPYRYPHRSGTRRTDNARSVDAFQLVGTMSYEKGMFAFFDGSNADYRKALERDGSIAGFTLTAIKPNAVVLAVNNKPVELKVGDQMRRDEEAGWQLVQDAEMPPVSPAVEQTNATDTPADDVGGDPNDVIRKLMQRREEELK